MASPEPVAGKAAARSTLSGTTVLRLHELPAAVSEALSHYDKDGDGVIDINELVNAGTQAQFDAKNVRRLVKVAVALFCLCVFNLAAIFGLVFSVVALTKDSKVDSNNQLVTRSGTPVSTAPALAVLPIGATALPAAFAYVAFTTAQGYNFSLSVDGTLDATGDPHHHCMLTSRLGTLPPSPGYVAIPNQPGAAVLFTQAGNLLYYQGDATPVRCHRAPGTLRRVLPPDPCVRVLALVRHHHRRPRRPRDHPSSRLPSAAAVRWAPPPEPETRRRGPGCPRDVPAAVRHRRERGF